MATTENTNPNILENPNIFECLPRKTETVSIPLAEYINLKQGCSLAEILRTAIWKSAKLSYTPDRLAFNDDLIEPIMHILQPDTYDNTLIKLRREKENKND